MEVHAHTHTPRRKWTHYFWEFLMLFLAVFCGFLAEYQLEHKIERDRGKQFIHSFYQDLKTDTFSFASVIAFDEEKRTGLKQIFSCYDTLKKDWKSTSCLVELARNSTFNRIAIITDGTMQQLKNAGGFRLLKKADRDSIIKYDYAIRAYKDFEVTIFQESQDNVRNTFTMLLDFRSNRFLHPQSAGTDSSNIEMPLLFSNNKELMNKYFNDLFRYRQAIDGQIRQVKILQAKAISLIEYFKNKYFFQ